MKLGATDLSFVIIDLVLRPGRFGPPKRLRLPYEGITGSNHHNTLTPIYPLGTVLQLWNSDTGYQDGTTSDGAANWCEFVYGRFDEGPTLVARHVLIPKVVNELFDFTNDKADMGSEVAQHYAVVAISTMTDDYYGWFWSGGVCPSDLVGDAFSATATVEVVSAGAAAGSSLQAAALSVDAIGFAITDGTQEDIALTMLVAS